MDAMADLEAHRLFKVGHRIHSLSAIRPRASPRLRDARPLPKPWLMMLKNSLLVAAMLLAILPAAALAQPIDPKIEARIDRILKATPLIDGHNDLPEQLREHYQLSIEGLASGTDRRAQP